MHSVDVKVVSGRVCTLDALQMTSTPSFRTLNCVWQSSGKVAAEPAPVVCVPSRLLPTSLLLTVGSKLHQAAEWVSSAAVCKH